MAKYFPQGVTMSVIDLHGFFSMKKPFPLIYISSLLVFMFFFSFLVHNLQKSFHKLQYICCIVIISHYVKSVYIQSYSGPYFLAFGLNTKRYSVCLRIQSECRKIRTRTTSNTGTFYAVSG